MARADNEITEYRKRQTELLDALYGVYDVLAVVEGVGATDAERAAFYTEFFENSPDYDITLAEFFEGVAAWRSLRTWLETATNRVPLHKSRT